MKFKQFLSIADKLNDENQIYLTIPRNWWLKRDLLNLEVHSVEAEIYDDGFRYENQKDYDPEYSPEMDTDMYGKDISVPIYPKNTTTEIFYHKNLDGLAMIVKLYLDNKRYVLKYDGDSAADFYSWVNSIEKIMSSENVDVPENSNVEKFLDLYGNTWHVNEIESELRVAGIPVRSISSHSTSVKNPTIDVSTIDYYNSEAELLDAIEQPIIDALERRNIKVKSVKVRGTYQGWDGPLIGYQTMVVTL